MPVCIPLALIPQIAKESSPAEAALGDWIQEEWRLGVRDPLVWLPVLCTWIRTHTPLNIQNIGLRISVHPTLGMTDHLTVVSWAPTLCQPLCCSFGSRVQVSPSAGRRRYLCN